ncbi:MAG: signal recognition particle-docking protein FtsY [Rickettsiales bacterium]|jgi:fused signal recognition particle receptor|nr:signal recognition particle-docking protein FtsY [Rickettsiales bacterium]
MGEDEKKIDKSSEKIQKGLFSIFSGKKLEKEMLDELEEFLIAGDLGAVAAGAIVDSIKNNRYQKNILVDDVKRIMFNKLYDIVKRGEMRFVAPQKPCVLLFFGVNGSGKTTAIAKVANKFKSEGAKVLLAAGDTFRAGAAEQLENWAKKISADIVKKQRDSEDPASLIYRAYVKAKDDGYDYIMADTAGRLQNNANLMEELGKIARVLKKIDGDLPHQSILTLDANIGQNSLKQFEGFSRAVNIDSIILNKMDGSSRGGIIVSLIERYKKPIFALGVGEKIDDIKDFNGEEFLNNLLGLS